LPIDHRFDRRILATCTPCVDENTGPLRPATEITVPLIRSLTLRLAIYQVPLFMPASVTKNRNHERNANLKHETKKLIGKHIFSSPFSYFPDSSPIHV